MIAFKKQEILEVNEDKKSRDGDERSVATHFLYEVLLQFSC
jgi:hypothetical protein